MKGIIFLIFILFQISWSVKTLPFTVLAEYPHNSKAFTQGLYYDGQYMYEGTGLYRETYLRKQTLETGTVLQEYRVPDDAVFGEGITIFKDKIFQLTWKNKIVYQYNSKSFTRGPEKTFKINTEGWGLTHNDTHLILSDGSSTIYFLSPNTLQVVSKIKVTVDGAAVSNLNELEFVHGKILANVWYQNHIVIIDPRTGVVNEKIDLQNIRGTDRSGDVLNGIAYDTTNKRLFVTGKLWNRLFAIKVDGLEPNELKGNQKVDPNPVDENPVFLDQQNDIQYVWPKIVYLFLSIGIIAFALNIRVTRS
eukprot:TRINITY_DN4034_c0_g1_i1.p1 TRINITY_DN4034_c0_g1~~TRINITY_DN4034_c0_g1_i1.p1  ORF type:complete len:306 (+),score=59.92 TRINITY_DN4034_c0_g1_i1:51-968(+)